MISPHPILETKQVTLSFGGLMALNRVDFSLHGGEIRALIGPNGAGKTSLFNVMTGVLKPSSGSVFFKGEDITSLPPYRRVKLGMGRSFQLVNLFPELTVEKNVEIAVQAALKKKNHPFEFVDRKQVKSRTEEIFSKFEWIENPHMEAGALIYAEQKKLETILALASEPELIFLDEPTAGIDENDISLIIDMIKHISKNRTVLITDHDIRFVMNIAQKITVLDQGSIIAEGLPSEIAADPKVDEVYFGGTG
jgi:branched-chain amino acid transport system ATP-binding protein